MPTIFGLREHVTAGGLMGYTPRIEALQARAAEYVVRVLKGEHPRNLPIERPTSFELLVNLQAARALGLTIAASVLTRADEVIE
jgi:putative ABC transport system substrate-binding protein